jgi:hypothetical protein
MARAIRRIILTAAAPIMGRVAGAELYVNNISYAWVVERCGGLLLESVEIRSGATYEPQALEYLLSRVRKE